MRDLFCANASVEENIFLCLLYLYYISEECNAVYLSNSTVDLEPHCAGTVDLCVQYSSDSQWTDHESVRRDSSLTQPSQCIYSRVQIGEYLHQL